MVNIGDRYVLEIGDIYWSLKERKNGDVGIKCLYKAKGFNSLVFDEEGIRKLTPLGDVPFSDEKKRQHHRGKEIRTVTIDVDMANVEEDVWCLAYEISRMPRETLGEIFGASHSSNILELYSYQEARKLMEEYRNGKGIGK